MKKLFYLIQRKVPRVANRLESFCGGERVAVQVLHEWVQALPQGYLNTLAVVDKLSKMLALASHLRFYHLSFVPLTILPAPRLATVLCPTCSVNFFLNCSRPPKN